MSKKKKGKKEAEKKKKGKSKDPSSRLKALQKKWKKASPKRFGQQAPDGSYEVKIISAVIEEAKAESKRLQIKWGLKILEGDYKDRELTHRSGLEGDEALDYLQGELDVLSVELPENITELPDLLAEVIGLELLVSLSTRNEFQNIRFEELLEADDDDDDDEEEEEEDADEEKEEEEEEEEEEESEEEEEEEEEEDEPYPTTKEIKKMKKPVLLKLIEEYALEVDPEGLSLKELQAAVVEASVEDEEAEDDDEEDED